MAFSIGVEMLNLKLRKSKNPVHLHQTPSRAEVKADAPAAV